MGKIWKGGHGNGIDQADEENRATVEAYKKNGYHVLPYLQMTKEVRN